MELEFYKSELLRAVMDDYYATARMTNDSPDFVPSKYTSKIDKILFKEFKKKCKQIKPIYKAFLKERKIKIKNKKLKEKLKKEKEKKK